MINNIEKQAKNIEDKAFKQKAMNFEKANLKQVPSNTNQSNSQGKAFF